MSGRNAPGESLPLFTELELDEETKMARQPIKSEHLHIRIPAELKRAIEREAKRLHVKPSDLIRMTMAERCVDQRWIRTIAAQE